jgi:hypothetical protein
MEILARNPQQINTGPIGLIWSPPRSRYPLEPGFLCAVLRALDRLRRQCPGAIVCRIHWEPRSGGAQQDFLSAEAVEFAAATPALPQIFAGADDAESTAKRSAEKRR